MTTGFIALNWLTIKTIGAAGILGLVACLGLFNGLGAQPETGLQEAVSEEPHAIDCDCITFVIF